MALKPFKQQDFLVQNVKYVKENGESSDRNIIVMAEPLDQYKALDVSDLPAEAVETIRQLLLRQKKELADLLASYPTQDKRPRWKNFHANGLTSQ